jgi:hypothetical protein
MPIATETQIRDFLEGYGITTSVLSDAWIAECRDYVVVPHIEDITGLSFAGVKSITEFYSGNGSSTLILNRKPVIAITDFRYIGAVTNYNLLGTLELIAAEGMLKAKTDYIEGVYGPIFRRGNKNIVITYTYGTSDYPGSINNVIKRLVSTHMLTLIGNRTGGGDLSVQAHSRSYGPHGKYGHLIKQIAHTAYQLLKPYMTSVVGS